MIDLKLLQMLKYRSEYYKIIGRVPSESIEKTTNALLKDFGKYFTKFPDHECIDMMTFAPLFGSWHPKLDADQKSQYSNVLKRVRLDVPEEEKDGILHTLLELRLAADMAAIQLRYDAGEVENLHSAITLVSDEFKLDANVRGIDFVRVDVNDMMAMEEDDTGLEWRLSCLRESMRPLRGGDFGIIAGRPDKGKTTFIASEVTNLAAQDERTVVWLNNEGLGNRIYSRLWQAGTGSTMSQMKALHQQHQLIPTYENAIKGDQWKIRVFDIHGMDTYAVEQIIDQNKPSVVVFDMIDNIRGFPMAGRTDERLEQMYGWGRNLAVKYEFVGLATSQISGDGANLRFPADHMLKDSKTGKQGACDFILMIGAVDDPGFAACRFIGLPKNKLKREGVSGDPKATVAFKPDMARYVDLAIDDYPPEPEEEEELT